jgi:hypothetical protein
MAFNPFLGKSQEWLETELSNAQRDFSRGKATVGATSADMSIRSEVEISLTQRIQLILRALNRIDPTTYPIEQISPISATKAVFS